MKCNVSLAVRIAAFAVSLSLAIIGVAAETIVPVVSFVARPLPLSAVRLTGGPLRHAQELDAKYLLALAPDRMLAGYRIRAGLAPKANAYGGWDAVDGKQLTGHFAGHYLSAVSLMWAATGDPRFKERADYIVKELKQTQDKQGDGYLGALAGGKERFAEVARGDIRSASFDLNGLWSPWYVLHKTFAGLRDAYRYTGNRTALEVEIKFAAWAEGVLAKLDDRQVQRMLGTEFGGMNEVLADLYADTGDQRWLDLSDRFQHRSVIEPMARHEDILAGKHANTQVPKLFGSLVRYTYTGNEVDGNAARYFWDQVVGHHTFSSGGHGKDEYFGPPDKLNDRVDGRTAETCNVYNMLKMTRKLFALSADIRYAEFHERALFNHILASIDPEDGRMCYMVPVGRGVTHEYQDMFGDFTCCVGTGMESHALHGDGIYYEAADRLWVNLYIPSTAEWKSAGVKLAMETSFPEGDSATLRLTLQKPRQLTLALRRPSWAGEGFRPEVNGVPVRDLPKAGSYVELRRRWQSGDTIRVVLPKTIRTEPLPDNPRRVALMWGPLVLAGEVRPAEMPTGAKRDSARPAQPRVPVLVAAGQPVEKWLKPVAGQPGRFRTDGVGRDRDVDFLPFYRLHRRPYAVYWDLLTPDDWRKKSAEHAAAIVPIDPPKKGRVPRSVPASSLYGYYTRVDSGGPFERFSRVDDYADIVVKLETPDGQLVFSRGRSYLPYWQTAKGKWPFDEIVQRSGDGTTVMPDRVNLFSNARIIDSSASKVIVQWRYLSSFTPGNPCGNLDPNNFVEEVFTITSDARVIRVVKQGTRTIDQWNDPLNQTTQVLKLADAGISEVSRTKPARSARILRVKGGPERGPAAAPPSVWFKFDEAQGDEAREAISGVRVKVAGHKTLWKQGVSGTALEFDGYHSVVALPAGNVPVVRGDLSLEGWIALGAYSWNWAPIVQQGDNDGYFLGVDSHGYPGFMARIGGVWQQLSLPSRPPYADANHLALFRWYHIVGTYGKADGTMRLYVNGKEIAAKKVGSGGVQSVPADLRIGKAAVLRMPTEALHDTFPSEYGLDGLIDEVRIYKIALSASQVAESYKNFRPGASVVAAPDMQKRAFPNPTTGGVFKAVYTHVPYYETWENLWRFGQYPDVVVGFDRLPIKYVFWRGVSYIPMIVNERNQWYTNEFNETGGPTAPGDNEPMSDKGCWNSHVRIIENTPARVVIHWRYWLSNPDHHWANYNATTGWGDISDWYYYIYPDGVAAKRMRCYTSQPDGWHEWQETIAVLGEGQHPETVLSKSPVLTLVDAAGKTRDYDWNPEPPAPDYRNQIIHLIHYKGRYSPFTIQRFDGGDVYSGERTWYSVFPSWNHWPTSQVNSSGRNASFTDRAAHSSVNHLFWPISGQQRGDVPYLEKTLMEGMTDQSAASLVDLAKSWLQAPPLETISDCRASGYDMSQRAYVLTATGPAPSWRIVASAEHPLVNACFVVKNWNCDDEATLEVDSQPQARGPAFRQGIVRDPNGRQTLIVWLELNCSAGKTFMLRGAKPAASAHAKPTAWAEPPRLDRDFATVCMKAIPVAGLGVAYRFQCMDGPGHSSGWQSTPFYIGTGLRPETQFVYCVKTRDYYGAESEWSPAGRVATGAAPAPVVGNMDEDAGGTIKDGVIAGRKELEENGAGVLQPMTRSSINLQRQPFRANWMPSPWEDAGDWRVLWNDSQVFETWAAYKRFKLSWEAHHKVQLETTYRTPVSTRQTKAEPNLRKA